LREEPEDSSRRLLALRSFKEPTLSFKEPTRIKTRSRHERGAFAVMQKVEGRAQPPIIGGGLAPGEQCGLGLEQEVPPSSAEKTSGPHEFSDRLVLRVFSESTLSVDTSRLKHTPRRSGSSSAVLMPLPPPPPPPPAPPPPPPAPQLGGAAGC
jgi:hypothetical protein